MLSLIASKIKRKNLFEPVSGLSLAVFRIMFGLMLTYDSFKDALQPEMLERRYYSSALLFKYQFFGWVKIWPEPWMADLHYWVMGIAALFVMAGAFYRPAIIIFTLLFAYAFFMSEIDHLNHYYLVIVIGVLLCFLPANRCLSFDRVRHTDWNDNIPRWTLWSVRTLVEIVLIYAGVAKLNYDWLHLEPLGTWLREREEWRIFGDLVLQDWFIAIGAYGSIALHLAGAPLLFYKPTRLWVFLVYCAFHLMNAYTFDIGIFPYLTIAATLPFFEADWPRIVFEKLKKPRSQAKTPKSHEQKENIAPDPSLKGKLAFSMVILWLAVQTLLPLRHFLYPGNPSWTEEGHKYAWHMKLRSKRAQLIAFHVRDPVSNQTWLVNPHDYLGFRSDTASEFGEKPDMLLQFAYFLEKVWHEKGFDDVEVYCESYVSLNYRRPALIVDPEVDLTTKKWDIWPADWVLPLNEPLIYWKDRTTANTMPR